MWSISRYFSIKQPLQISLYLQCIFSTTTRISMDRSYSQETIFYNLTSSACYEMTLYHLTMIRSQSHNYVRRGLTFSFVCTRNSQEFSIYINPQTWIFCPALNQKRSASSSWNWLAVELMSLACIVECLRDKPVTGWMEGRTEKV
jgi:hypothetical protein